MDQLSQKTALAPDGPPVYKRSRLPSSPCATAEGKESTMIVNEVLWYWFKNIHQLDAKMLKSVILDFYETGKITVAKDILSKVLDDLKPDKWVSIPRQRDSRENPGYKIKQDFDDIITLITFIDKKSLFPRIPKFIALDPDALPSAKIT